MVKMLLKDFAAVACGLICAMICFSILLHYNFFRGAESAQRYEKEQPRTIDINRAIYKR